MSTIRFESLGYDVLQCICLFKECRLLSKYIKEVFDDNNEALVFDLSCPHDLNFVTDMLSNKKDKLTCLHLIGDKYEKAIEQRIPSIASKIVLLKQLKKMKISRIGFVGMATLAPTLVGMTGLRSLDLRDNGFGENGMTSVLSFLGELTNIQTLDLSRAFTCIGGKMAYLASSLKNLTRLLSLDLSRNSFSEHGMRDLAAVFKDLTSLKTLNISNNLIQDGGVMYLCNDLKYLTLLHTLDISDNLIGDIGISRLAPTLRGLTGLRILDLSKNLFGEEEASSFEEFSGLKIQISPQKYNTEITFGWTATELFSINNYT